MYQYDDYDKALVNARVAQFRNQTARYLAGKLTEDQFRPLRLQNGLYIQRHAPMLRIAIPYGLISAKQLSALASISRRYDRGYAHFTTRQNFQLNWPELAKVPDILGELAAVEMHGIQTSGNCIRSITTDHFAGIAADEIADSRPWAEILRQWSTLHPEFAYLPRKFKVAISGSQEDRAAIRVHDIGLQLIKNDSGELGFRVFAGGGLGRTPLLGQEIKAFLPWPHLLTYCEAILRVYNRFGRRDNLYKARIKILVKALGSSAFAEQVDAEWEHLKDGPATLLEQEVARVASHFKAPFYEKLPPFDSGYLNRLSQDRAFGRWVERNVHPHRVGGYAAVSFSLKSPGHAPGDATAEQLDAMAALAERYSLGELRVSHEQNLILADVRQSDLFALWQAAKLHGLATPTIGLLTDIIACPGGDFCGLANARSIPVANAIQERFAELDYLHDIGELALNISGCMNSCGHHHLGHIGILGVDKNGEEWYQITIGGRQGNATRIGEVIGRSVAAAEVTDVVSRLIETYLSLRHEEEPFIDAVHRLGLEPFRDAAYQRSTQAISEELENA
jgi:sulfite reductase (NADPH) hemoprotein beta-component